MWKFNLRKANLCTFLDTSHPLDLENYSCFRYIHPPESATISIFLCELTSGKNYRKKNFVSNTNIQIFSAQKDGDGVSVPAAESPKKPLSKALKRVGSGYIENEFDILPVLHLR